jgi:ABC-type bacteriocin/lantibiotic exporter with double-glycine peptidase domain
MIRIEQLRFGYRQGDDVLQLAEFDLAPQADVLVVGPSGCGKTTLLHLIAGLLLGAAQGHGASLIIATHDANIVAK